MKVRRYCTSAWPTFLPATSLLTQNWHNRQRLTIGNDLLMFDKRIVFARHLRLDILRRVNESHLGIIKCKALAQTSVWCPNISSQMKKCLVCSKLQPENLSVPDRPWMRLVIDLVYLKGKTYLALTDYYSR
ncbi:Pol polyprotein [Plakobranchus ocellatus]|uniref:Pol polyprotein n=1 Tax=Plakobranchus ocellatus TaxID=259542 RepID=A0AAV4AB74_9GAST|nr:Pol polyprotein [Plakobranchus ocellatus]